MRRYISALALLGLLFTAKSSAADPIAVGDLLRFYGSEGSLGGPFLVDNISNGEGVDFLSFCVQMTQYIDYTSTFRVGAITDSADDPGGSDAISLETAWIFSGFRNGALGSYSVDEIQAAIWNLEDEWTTTIGNSAALISLARY
jgi:hypothetical protein